jgi:hypothetical protein
MIIGLQNINSDDDEDIPVMELIARLQEFVNSIPEHERNNAKCGVRSYWTDNGGYLDIYITQKETQCATHSSQSP